MSIPINTVICGDAREKLEKIAGKE